MTAGRQIDTERIPPEQDSSDLYRRAAASRLVVIGTVVKSEGIGKRLSQSDIEKMKRPAPNGTIVLSLDGTFGGSLYTVQIENILCRQADIHSSAPDAPEISRPGQFAHIFVPRDEPMFTDGHEREMLLAGQRYLLFLVLTPQPVRKGWVDSFQLDPKQEYYRGEELSRGVIPLPENRKAQKQPLVLRRVAQLCHALRPVTLAGKLAALRTLAASRDPVLKEEAGVAVKALQAQSRSPK